MQTVRNNKILFLVNHDIVIYNFRLEIVERLLNDGYEVFISSPYGERIEDLTSLGCKFIPTEIDRHGLNPFYEIKLIRFYKKIMKNIKPLTVLSYTIKPNIYGGIAAKALKIPYIVNITGLGSSIESRSILQKFIIFLYKIALNKAEHVFFQNSENKQLFLKYKLVNNNYSTLPGSGVNLERFYPLPYPDTAFTEFAFISRIMKEKGINEYLQAAEAIISKYPDTRFHVCGFCDGDYEDTLSQYIKKGVIIYHGMVRDIRDTLKSIHCTILPSYFEGMSNALLESAASGRPIIASDIPGCKETFDEGISGYGVIPRNRKDLTDKIEKFILLTNEQKRIMGENARAKMEREFDRRIVVNEYMKKISSLKENKYGSI